MKATAAAVLLCLVAVYRPALGTVAIGIPDSDAFEAIEKALSIAHVEFKEQSSEDEMFLRDGIDSDGSGKPWTYTHHINQFRFMKKSSFSESEHAQVVIRATQELSRMFGKSIDDLMEHPNIRAIWRKLNAPFCSARQPMCPKLSVYRTADGSCNNMDHPTWGMSGRPQKRYLSSAYSDGVSAPRMFSLSGKPLPSARLVSNVIHRAAICDLKEPHDSAMLMQWGQLLDHDFAETPTMKGYNGADIRCCNLDKYGPTKRPACFPIAIPHGDKRFSSSCMSFVRSTPGPNDYCDFGVRDQLNQASAYIDAGYIYGHDQDTMDKVRVHKGGMLKVNKFGLFIADDDQEKCIKSNPLDYCMKSGDGRIHIAPGQTSTQVIMMREHNRIALILGKLNPHWSDELLFQEARKIVAAINQHITYTEYLPFVLGPGHMKRYGLYSTRLGHHTSYEPDVDATMANVFGAAAFRFGHSQVSGDVTLVDQAYRRKRLRIEDTFNRPTAVLSDFGKGCDHVNRWLAVDRSAKSDRFLEPGVRDYLFLDQEGHSFDLAALNIQRGRDHGLPGYNAWRKFCGLPTAYHFGSGPGGLVDIEPEVAHLLSKLYAHPDDIDLYPAGLSERHVHGGAMGPTFACIIGRQFQEWKWGDRFWYENKFAGSGFTEHQLNEIKKIRLSRVMCNHMPDAKMQRNVFQVPSSRNPKVPCAALPDINFGFWKDLIVLKSFGPPLAPPALLNY